MKEFFSENLKPIRLLCLFLILSLMLVLSGCGGAEESDENAVNDDPKEKTIEIFAMDTYMTITVYGDNAESAAEKAGEEINRIDELLSTGNPESEISKLNSEKKMKVSPETFDLIKRSKDIGSDTNGVFDITIYPVMRAWGFAGGDYRVPPELELREILNDVDYTEIELNEDDLTVRLKDTMEVDLGGIAKGYTSDRLRDLLTDCGIEHALINLGGNVYVLGNKTDGSDWRVAIMDPEDQSGYIGGVAVSDKAVITSGGYQRFFEEDGKRYIHIIDPSDGYPASSGLISATVVSDDGTLADALSTSLFIMGPDKAVDYWRANADKFECVLVEDDGTVLVTEGLKDCYFTDGEFEIVSQNG